MNSKKVEPQCKECIHAYKEYPYEKDGEYFYCGLHAFGTIKKDFYCKDFSAEEKSKQ